MGTITHTFDAGQSVWVITTATASCPSAVLGGTVIQVRAVQQTSGTTVTYDVRLGSENGTTVVDEANMFASLAEATTEYEIRLS